MMANQLIENETEEIRRENIVNISTRKKPVKNKYLEAIERVETFVREYHGPQPSKMFQHELCKLLCYVERSEAGNALRMYARFGLIMHWVPERGKWVIWRGNRWEIDEEGQAIEFALVTTSYIESEADSVPLPVDKDGSPLMLPQIVEGEAATPEQVKIIEQFKQRDALVKALHVFTTKCRSRNSQNSALDLLKSHRGITRHARDFDKDDHLFNVKNGTLDLRTFNLLPHTKSHLITKIASVEYDTSALCPRWDSFLVKAMESRDDLVREIRQEAGAGLCGENRADELPVYFGSGGNGKSVYVESLKKMMGDYAGTTNADLFIEKRSESISNDLARLDGIRYLTASETKDGRHLDEGLVKNLTGGDTVTARFLRCEFFEFKPKFTPILLTNHKPIIKGTDDGIWRRLHFIPWDHNFEKDPDRKVKGDVLDELSQEFSGILNWCIAGFKDRQENGAYIAPIVAATTQEYRDVSDIIGNFLEEKCVVGYDHKCTISRLYTAYSDYMRESGHNALAKPRFGDKFRERGFEQVRTGKDGLMWKGIGLRYTEQPSSEPEHIREQYTSTQPVPVQPVQVQQSDEDKKRIGEAQLIRAQLKSISYEIEYDVSINGLYIFKRGMKGQRLSQEESDQWMAKINAVAPEMKALLGVIV